MEGNKEVFFQAGRHQKEARSKAASALNGADSLGIYRAYSKGGGIPRVPRLGLYWQDLLSRDQTPDAPQNIWSRKGGSSVGAVKEIGLTQAQAT